MNLSTGRLAFLALLAANAFRSTAFRPPSLHAARKTPPTATAAKRVSDWQNGYTRRKDNVLFVTDAQQVETDVVVAADSPQAEEVFVNDGPLSWMTTYLDLFGVKEGKSIYMGPIPVDVDDSKRLSPEEAAAAREQAAKNLININMDERQRRRRAGSVMTVLSIVYITWASLVADDGGLMGHVLRFFSAFPLFLAVGYKLSASTGLCNVAQSGMWDVDGNGLSKIEDPNLARTILERVNNMNLETALKVFVPVTAFALLPQSTSAPMAFFLAIFAVLYAVRDRVPQA